MRFWITLSAVFLLDQVSKAWIAGRFSVGESHTLVEGCLWLTYIRNPGASFGMLQGQTWLFLGLAMVMVLALVYYHVKYHPESWLQYSLGLMAGGSLGNMLDRLRYRAVQDFIDLGWWPVFNLADTAITVGGACLIFYLLRQELGKEQG